MFLFSYLEISNYIIYIFEISFFNVSYEVETFSEMKEIKQCCYSHVFLFTVDIILGIFVAGSNINISKPHLIKHHTKQSVLNTKYRDK